MEPSVSTFSGRLFNFMRIDPREISIFDIAHSLSMQCRFNGHTMRFYSVAEHSILMARLIANQDPLVKLYALLHDAHEAYLGDMIRPVKHIMGDAYEGIARMVQGAIEHQLLKGSLPHTTREAIRILDNRIMSKEVVDLMASTNGFEAHLERFPPPGNFDCDVQFECMYPHEAKMRFVHLFFDLLDKAGMQYKGAI